MGTFVAVGNATQPFTRMLNAVVSLLPRLPHPIVVQHGSSPFPGGGWTARAFIDMTDFNRQMAEADLLILHAGAGCVIHAIQTGKIPVVMPRLARYGEVVDDHQVEFARALAREGKIILAEEPHELLAAVEETLKRKPVSPDPHQAPPIVDLVSNILRDYAKTLGK